jgi:UDP-N-acetylmuramoyl-L-alanyl-D-glutamate--2,6-diaminopimelate ligase
MTLAELLAQLPVIESQGDTARTIAQVVYDSRKAQPDSLFVAIHGQANDGNQFVEAARRKGAVVVVSEMPPQDKGTWIRVPDAREALAVLSAAIYGQPAKALDLVGVTGTNGKTTTAFLIDATLRAAGVSTGLIGTVQYRVGERVLDATRTTPESADLQALFREMVDAGCRAAVLEVSSHSLALKRVFGCPFRVAVFTNLTRDHLDFHGDMDSYFAAKRILFEQHLRSDGVAVLNADDDRCAQLAASSRGRVWTYSLTRPADFVAKDVALTLAGARFTAETPVGAFEIVSPLLGSFNVENLLAALAAALALEVRPDDALRGLTSISGVPGRLERVQAGQAFAVIVDYAHTDDALRKLLETVRQLRPRRLITVFGCGGDRDRTKRPLMGAVAARLSDVVIVTSDNPRSEPPEAIIEEIQLGMNGGRKSGRLAIVDRREAIRCALEMASAEDAVVIAGKGHETVQVMRDRTLPFDDRQVVRELLGELAAGADGQGQGRG